jgi:hypothetical protein
MISTIGKNRLKKIDWGLLKVAKRLALVMASIAVNWLYFFDINAIAGQM